MHVGAALATPAVNRKHLFAFGSKYNFSKAAQILQELEPEKKILAMKDDGWDQTEVPNKRAESLVQALNGHGRKMLEDNITDYLNSIKKLEGEIRSATLLLGHSLLICYHNHLVVALSLSGSSWCKRYYGVLSLTVQSKNVQQFVVLVVLF